MILFLLSFTKSEASETNLGRYARKGFSSSNPRILWGLPGIDSGVLVELLVLKQRGLPYIDLPSPLLCLHHQDCTSKKGKNCLFVCIPGVNFPPFGEIESERIYCKFCKTDFKLDWFRRRVPIFSSGDFNFDSTQRPHSLYQEFLRHQNQGLFLAIVNVSHKLGANSAVEPIMKTNNGQVHNHYCVPENELD